MRGIFLIFVIFVILVVLWRNSFFEAFLSSSCKAAEDGNEVVESSPIKEIKEIKTSFAFRRKLRIPKWYSRESANWVEVTPRHRQFYRYWVKQLDTGNFMDIGEELGYVFIYMKRLLAASGTTKTSTTCKSA